MALTRVRMESFSPRFVTTCTHRGELGMDAARAALESRTSSTESSKDVPNHWFLPLTSKSKMLGAPQYQNQFSFLLKNRYLCSPRKLINHQSLRTSLNSAKRSATDARGGSRAEAPI